MGKKILIFISVILFNIQLKAQELKTDYVMGGHEEELLEKAEYNFEKENYSKALSLYLKLDRDYPGVIEYIYFAGICYLYETDEQEKAIEYLEKAYNEKRGLPDIDFYLGKAYLLNYRFDDATKYFKLALENKNTTDKNRKKTVRLMENCENGKVLLENYVEGKLSIENAGAPVNTEFSEYVPLVSSDESVMIFTYRGKKSKGGLQNVYGKPDPEGEYYEDVFISYRLGTKWLEPEDIGFKINTEGHDAAMALSTDGQKLFLYKNTNGGDIYMSTLERTWSTPLPLKGKVNSKYWEGSSSISLNGKTLYFSSERPGGYGGKDIYKATLLDNGTWGNIENIGKNFNTPYNEDAPFIHPNGELLYFSSEGHNSMGGYDIFHSTFEDSAWSEPENIGYPVNTTNDDIFYVVTVNGERGYFSSGRKGGQGGQDIYIVKPGVFGKKPVLALIKGIIKNDGRNAGATIRVVNVTTDEAYGIYKSNDASGNYILVLPPGADYKIDFEHQGMLKHTENVDIKGLYTYVEVDQDFELSAEMNPAIGATDQIQIKLDEILAALKTEEADADLGIADVNPDKIGTNDTNDGIVEEVVVEEDTVEEGAVEEEVVWEEVVEDEIVEEEIVEEKAVEEEVVGEEIVEEEAVEEEIVEEKVVEEKVVEEKVVEEKVIEEEVVEEKVVEEEVVEEKVVEEKVAEEKVAEEKVVKEEVIEEKVVEEKVAEEKVAEEKVAEEKVVEEHKPPAGGSDKYSDKFENILFDFDKSTLRPKSKQTLNKIYEYLNENKNAELEIAGHADAIGTEQYNMKLSDRRARAAGNFLMNKGVDDSRLNLFTYGESQPVAPNAKPDGSDNPQGRQLNRRAEFSTTKGTFQAQAPSPKPPSAAIGLPQAKQVTSYKLQGILYKVQVAAYRHPENYNNAHLADLGKLETLIIDGITRFTIGQFATLAEARQFKKIVFNRGTKDAFITATVNGERKYLFELSSPVETASRLK